MDPEHRVQVVLGEGEPNDGLLRFILEGEGFDIVGLASDDDELARVLRGARPQVVVLDGGISAPAALEARERAKGASLVVVWPDGVAAVIAEERVDPSSSVWDLGDAVRRAAQSAHVADAVVRVPEAQAAAPREDERRPQKHADVRITPPPPAHARGRRGQLLVAAATWMLALTALASIAIAVPHALNFSSPHGGGRRSLSVPLDRSDDVNPDERVTTPRSTGTVERPADCEDPGTRRLRTDRAQGAPAARGRAEGCPQRREPQRREKDDAGTKGGGRPDDPGSKGNGPGSKSETPSDDRGGPDGSKKPDPEPPESGRSGDTGNGQGKSSAGHAARTDAGNTG